jgi:hypothetical protein
MKRKRKGNHHFENWDYYAMLELEHLRWRASLSDIKEAYKRSSLRHAARAAVCCGPLLCRRLTV